MRWLFSASPFGRLIKSFSRVLSCILFSRGWKQDEWNNALQRRWKQTLLHCCCLEISAIEPKVNPISAINSYNYYSMRPSNHCVYFHPYQMELNIEVSIFILVATSAVLFRLSSLVRKFFPLTLRWLLICTVKLDWSAKFFLQNEN